METTLTPFLNAISRPLALSPPGVREALEQAIFQALRHVLEEAAAKRQRLEAALRESQAREAAARSREEALAEELARVRREVTGVPAVGPLSLPALAKVDFPLWWSKKTPYPRGA